MLIEDILYFLATKGNPKRRGKQVIHDPFTPSLLVMLRVLKFPIEGEHHPYNFADDGNLIGAAFLEIEDCCF